MTDNRQHPSASASERFKKSLVRIAPLLLVGAGLAAAVILYAPTLFGGLLCDDYWYLELAQTTTFSEHPLLALRKGNFYYFRPLPSLIWSALYHLFSLHAPGYRISSLILHLLVVVSVFRLSRRVVKDEAAAALSAVIFAVHPLHAEAVCWVSANSDLMAALFAALSLERYLAWREADPGSRSLAPALILAVLAMLCKESAYVLPVIFALCELLPGARPKGKRVSAVAMAFGATAIIFGLKTIFAFGMLGPPTGANPLSAWPGSMGMSLIRFAFPAARSSFAAPINYLLAAALIIALVLAVMTKKNLRAVGFGLLFLFIALLPPTAVSRVGLELQFSRTLYLPSIGFALALAAVFARKTQTGSATFRQALIPAALAGTLVVALFAAAAMNLKPWGEAGQASRALEQAFYDVAQNVRPGQSVLAANVPLTIRGVPFHSNSYDLSLALAMTGFPEPWKARGFKDQGQLPVYAVLQEAPAIEAKMNPIKKLRELKAGPLENFDYIMKWASPWAIKTDQ